MLLLVAVSMYSLSFMWSYLHKQCEWISKTFIGKCNAVFLLYFTHCLTLIGSHTVSLSLVVSHAQDILNNLDNTGSCDLEDDDLMLDVDLPEDVALLHGKYTHTHTHIHSV